MSKKILVPLDGSELAEAAVPLAVAVAKATAARLCLVHIQQAGPVGRAQMPAAGEYLDGIAEGAAGDLNESVDTAVLRDDDGHMSKHDMAVRIAKYAGERAYDLIVLSTRGHGGLKRVFEGSVAEALLRVTPCPVLFCGPRVGERMMKPGPHPIRKLLVALDQTETSEDVLASAAAYARELNAEVVLLHVLQPMRAYATVTGMELTSYSADEWAALSARADAYLAGVRERLAAVGIMATSEIVVSNDAAAAILEAAARLNADIIALASKAPQRLVRSLFGSVGDRLVRTAPYPVLVTRATA